MSILLLISEILMQSRTRKEETVVVVNTEYKWQFFLLYRSGKSYQNSKFQNSNEYRLHFFYI